MSGFITSSAPVLLAAVQVLSAAAASVHVILYKRGVHAAIGWVALIWLVPFGGAVLYLLFGINRVRRRAAGLRARNAPRLLPRDAAAGTVAPAGTAATAAPPASAQLGHLAMIARVIDSVGGPPLTAGNAIEPLVGGSRAYAAMLAAIADAKRSVALSSYIFDNDAAGQHFVAALSAARARGAAVRVLIDGVGARYSYPSVIDALRRAGVEAAEYMPGLFPFFLHYANLRNHRKLLIVDGRVGFTGGMNVRASHLDDAPVASAIRDMHFRIEGPVVSHLAATFAEDWSYAAGERLHGAAWENGTEDGAADHRPGTVVARGIASGPDEDFERIRWTILSAIAQAKSRVRVVTPYFLPDTTLTAQLQLAALRGVAVDIVIPERNNLKLVEWASLARIGVLVTRGCRIWRSPPPFDHAKVMTVDGGFSLIGSANWDPRSFRLNFEFNVECYDQALAAALDGLIDARIAGARALDAAALAERGWLQRVRDGAAWLASPYL